MFQERSVQHRQHRLGCIVSERTEPHSLATNQNDRFQRDVRPSYCQRLPLSTSAGTYLVLSKSLTPSYTCKSPCHFFPGKLLCLLKSLYIHLFGHKSPFHHEGLLVSKLFPLSAEWRRGHTNLFSCWASFCQYGTFWCHRRDKFPELLAYHSSW